MFINHKQDDWVDWLPLAEFAYNNAKHEATGYTPFYLNRGRHPRALLTDPVMEEGTPVERYVEELQSATKVAEESLRKAKQAMKQR
jgi:hypothetical protein